MDSFIVCDVDFGSCIKLICVLFPVFADSIGCVILWSRSPNLTFVDAFQDVLDVSIPPTKAVPQANGDVRSYLRREVETVAASIPQPTAPVQLIIQKLAWYTPWN